MFYNTLFIYTLYRQYLQCQEEQPIRFVYEEISEVPKLPPKSICTLLNSCITFPSSHNCVQIIIIIFYYFTLIKIVLRFIKKNEIFFFCNAYHFHTFAEKRVKKTQNSCIKRIFTKTGSKTQKDAIKKPLGETESLKPKFV